MELAIPPQPFDLRLDTGSDIWVPEVSNPHYISINGQLNQHPEPCTEFNMFDEDASSTFQTKTTSFFLDMLIKQGLRGS